VHEVGPRPVVGERVDVRGEQREDRARAREQRQLLERRRQLRLAAALEQRGAPFEPFTDFVQLGRALAR